MRSLKFETFFMVDFNHTYILFSILEFFVNTFAARHIYRGIYKLIVYKIIII
jgi:hypothetical protein